MGTEQHRSPAEAPHVMDEATMKAVVQDEYGEAEDVLRVEEIDPPSGHQGAVHHRPGPLLPLDLTLSDALTSGGASDTSTKCTTR